MKKKIVYVAGCFDLLHKGHINLFQKAADLGYVIVGLLSDEAMKSFKREPLMSFEDRSILINAIKFTDKIIQQNSLDYNENLNKIKPDFVVHGNDWKVGVQKETRDKVIKTLQKWNGKLIEPDYTEGVSTSDIIKIIQNLNK
jgi:phosphoenolpyruvate phosphomutase / 2-hydroxyethylphosphonate cytidylyltransferase